ncbi:MAG: efflux RND transporter permease subunit [Cytophagales bacterium]
MWSTLTRWIITYRISIVVVLIGFTAFLGYQATKLEMSYEYGKIVPDSDPEMVFYNTFLDKFGEDGSVFAIGLKGDSLYNLQNFNRLVVLCQKLKAVAGIDEVIAIPTARQINRDAVNEKFTANFIFKDTLRSQAELDSNLKVFRNSQFYSGLIYNTQTKATIVAVVINKKVLNTIKRADAIQTTLDLSKQFAKETAIKPHFAGLPYIRFINTGLFKDEFTFMTILSAIVTCVILCILFRSFYALLFTIIVIAVTVIWSMGFTVLFGYKISVLTGMLPALIVIISIPNCIYMLNQYHHEFRKHGNKLKAVGRVIEKIGFVTFMTNINTAVGFFVLLITDITIIYEFGMIAGIMSVATYLISITVIPILFVFLPPPNLKQMMHLDKKTLGFMLEKVIFVVKKYRIAVYSITLVLLIVAGYGIYKVKAISYMVDDFPEGRTGIQGDLAFFEKNFGGVLPLEIMIDFHTKKAIYNIKNLNKIDELESELKTVVGLSSALSVNTLIKATVQAYYNNDSASYRLPTQSEKVFLAKYLKRSESELSFIKSLVDSSGSTVRISYKVADIGTIKMDSLVEKQVKPAIASVFKDTKFDVNLTGTSLLFLRGNQYLINDLGLSLVYAFILISIMMAFMFTDVKIIFISLIPNIIPMVITLGIMGLFDIRLKTSTAVIFSTSFGITIDSTIHFLSKFKQEIAHNKISILEAVIRSIKEAGISMLYTSGVLLIGFGIFMFSDFGQTVALGLLTCLTLFFATITNMILLPVLLVDFVNKKKERAMAENSIKNN